MSSKGGSKGGYETSTVEPYNPVFEPTDDELCYDTFSVSDDPNCSCGCTCCVDEYIEVSVSGSSGSSKSSKSTNSSKSSRSNKSLERPERSKSHNSNRKFAPSGTMVA